MPTPTRIAFIAAVGLAISTSVSQLLTQAHNLSSATVSLAIVSPLVLGVLVWVGTYIDARWVPARQRTIRLARVLGVLYLITGMAMTLPIKTHAVLRDMPPASSRARPLEFISSLVIYAGLPLVMVGSVFVARGLATICGRHVRSGA